MNLLIPFPSSLQSAVDIPSILVLLTAGVSQNGNMYFMYRSIKAGKLIVMSNWFLKR